MGLENFTFESNISNLKIQTEIRKQADQSSDSYMTQKLNTTLIKCKKKKTNTYLYSTLTLTIRYK